MTTTAVLVLVYPSAELQIAMEASWDCLARCLHRSAKTDKSRLEQTSVDWCSESTDTEFEFQSDRPRLPLEAEDGVSCFGKPGR